MKKMRILVTAGPTREYLDPVRFISNAASGKLGYLVCREAVKRGHRVTLITGPSRFEKPAAVRTIGVESAAEMKKALLEQFKLADVLIMTAAVGDWRPAKRASQKLKIKRSWRLRLVPNPDLLKAAVRIKKHGQVVAGFALETSDLLKNGWRKLTGKKLDFIVVNDASFMGEDRKKSAVFILSPDKSVENCTGFSKEKLAARLVEKAREAYEKKCD